MPKKNGRPRKNPDEKRRQRSVYLSSETLQALQDINPNISQALEQICRERRYSDTTARGTDIIEQLYHRQHPGTLATHVHTVLTQGKTITPAVSRLLRLLGERDPLTVS